MTAKLNGAVTRIKMFQKTATYSLHHSQICLGNKKDATFTEEGTG